LGSSAPPTAGSVASIRIPLADVPFFDFPRRAVRIGCVSGTPRALPFSLR
jgi:hypothetical protein